MDDDDTQVYKDHGDALTIAYQSGYYDGKKAAQPEQEPVAWADLQKEAQQIVESKALWKKFIDNTPLANDIACWMADFAQQYTAPPQRPWVDLTESEWFNWWRVSQVADETEAEIDFADFLIIAQAVTAKLKEQT